METRIVEYIKSIYEPEVILLGGSRAKGRETEKSDWDFFLLGSKSGKEGHIEFEDQRLDICFKKWPETDKPLTIPSGPLWPLKVLFDESAGKLVEVLTKTEQYYKKGPLELHKESVIERFEKLESWKRKMEKYTNNPMVEFFYAGIFYEFAIRAWLELRDRWSLAPAEALPIIEKEDPIFYEQLSSFMTSSSSERSQYTKALQGILAKYR